MKKTLLIMLLLTELSFSQDIYLGLDSFVCKNDSFYISVSAFENENNKFLTRKSFVIEDTHLIQVKKQLNESTILLILGLISVVFFTWGILIFIKK